VHNASLCKELGYFYHENNAHEGASRLLEAIRDHDDHWEEYRERQRSLIAMCTPDDFELVETCDRLFDELIAPVRWSTAS